MVVDAGRGHDDDKADGGVRHAVGADNGGFSKVIPLPPRPFTNWPGSVVSSGTMTLPTGTISRKGQPGAQHKLQKAGQSGRPVLLGVLLVTALPPAAEALRKLISAMFPVVYFTFKKMNLFIHLNRLREALRIPLP